MKDTKMIRVPSRGYVTTSRGQVIAPIMSPYRESISCIWSMITIDRATVEEQLPDGSFLKLDVQNFDKDNFVSKEKKEFVKPEMQEINHPENTFKNIDGQRDVPENDSQETSGAVNAEDVVEPPVNPENDCQNNPETGSEPEQPENAEPETDKVDVENDNTSDDQKTDGQRDVPENDSQETSGATITVNGQKRVDPRFNNKKNKNKNRNNNQNGNNNQSVAVTAEPVQ